MAIFKCEFCNNEFELRRDRGLKQSSCISCRGKQNSTHGMSGTKQYNVWQQMVQRCKNPLHKKYHIYGGKGITVCDDWLTFEGFWRDNESLYKDGLTIDRKDASLGYNVDNVRWIPKGKNSSETTKRRPVIQLTKRYEPLREWESAKYAADELGLTAAHISAVCGGSRQTHGGFRWEFKK
jgi:hypothetical protein